MNRNDLPIPLRQRWQPLRSGLINLFHYADEQFWYEDGRLLLRGNNGTGKSRVLALQLPFLLDAEVSPTRMEPDRSPSKRPEWNLLLGGKHRERLGYTWIEFGRLDAENQPHYLTLGCGLHAVEHRDTVVTWFFTTTKRINLDFSLLENATPHSRARLGEVLGDAGQIYRTQGEYRRAVDERLFRLGERYRSLMDLLIQLRVPQLSRDFDEQRMSDQLSGALPPLPPEVLTQVADAMRDLDEERQRLDELRQSAASVKRFRDEYQRYLQIAVKRRAHALSEAHNQYERSLRGIHDAERSLEQTQAAAAAAEQKHRAAETRHDEIRGALAALRSRPEMTDAQRINDLRKHVEHLKRTTTRVQADAERAKAQAFSKQQLVGQETKEVEQLRQQIQHDIDALAAQELPLAVHQAVSSAAPTLLDAGTARQSLQSIRHTIAACDQGVQALKQQAVKIAELKGALERQIGQLSALETQVDEQQSALEHCVVELRSAQRSLREALLAWFDQASVLMTELPPRPQWCARIGLNENEPAAAERNGDEFDLLESDPVEEVAGLIEAVAEVQRTQWEVQREDLRITAERLQGSRSQLEAELQRLAAGVYTPPPAPYTRDADARAQRRGAPLYELCEFADAIPTEERPNWEAALEASGLLGAWVTPEGTLESPHLADTTLLVMSPVTDPRPRLTCVLRAADSLPESMTAEVVVRILSGIGCGRHAAATWVDRDGTWQVGPATGAWTKAEVQHIGAGAREQRRQRQMAELSVEIEAASQQLQAIRTEIKSIDDQRRQLKEILEACPSNEPFNSALVRRHTAATQLRDSQQRLNEQLAAVGQARTEISQTEQRRDRDAGDLGLFAWVSRISSLEIALAAFRRDVESLPYRLDAFHQRHTGLSRWRQELLAAEYLCREESERVQQSAGQATAAGAELRTLEALVGADVKQVLDEIAEQQQRESAVTEELKSLQKGAVQLAQQLGQLQGKLGAAQAALQQQDELRAAVAHRMEQFVHQGMIDQALDGRLTLEGLSDPPWSATRAALVAKQLRAALTDVTASDAVWEQAQNSLQVQFRGLEQAMLPTGVTPQMNTHDEIVVTTVSYQGIVCSPLVLARRLDDEVREREVLITERERELFEQRLIGDISEALHRKIRDAHELCQRMNREVESRPMSTGMRLRFRWKPIPLGSDELKAACQTLLRKPAAMSEKDRGALGLFLQQRIQEARHRDDAGSWQQHLAEALDYRRWFAFDIERETSGVWQRLTRRTHGTGSGGERAVALVIPLLAALAAYYQSADEAAPRLILMDEAFVGIDNEMRAKFMDLMVQFELDFVMTSEREWGCYSSMPGLAIYHLSTRRGVDAILPTRWVWNGNQRLLSDVHDIARQPALFEMEG